MKIACRSQLSKHCYEGMPEKPTYLEGIQDDGTWDGETVICDPCYIALGQPLKGTVEFDTGKEPEEPTDFEIYNRHGVEGGIPYKTDY